MTKQSEQKAATLAESPASIADILIALQAGEFEKARVLMLRSRRVAGNYLPFLDLMQPVLELANGAAFGWHSARQELLEKLDGNPLFGGVPFISPEAARTFLAGATVNENVKQAEGAANFYFVTIGGDTLADFRCDLPRSAGGIIIDAVIEVRTSIDHNFSIELELADGTRERLLSLFESGFTVYDQIAYTAPVKEVRRLFTFVIEPTHCRIYANGVLCWRHKRSREVAPVSLGCRLVGIPSVTDGVYVHGLEIASFAKPFPGLVEGEAGRYEELARSLLLAKQPRELWMLRRAVEEIPLEGVDEQKSELLEDLAKERGFRDWLFDDLSSILPPEAVRSVAVPQPVITVQHLTALYSRNPGKEFHLTSYLRGRKKDEFMVLNDVDFRIFPGDVVGIIGRNGAGKTTLLRALVGTLPLAQGRILIRGRAMLLRPGLGMREELTGRENISIAAVYMGLSRRQVNEVIQDVIEFSELGEAIDRPIKYYSDGMRSRLIFSMATAISPEILLLDELLGAGDIGFRDKAARRLDAFLGAAKAVVVVTHGLGFVREKCNKALYMKGGRLAYAGDPETACSRYLSDLHKEYGHDPHVGIDDEDQMARGA